jgi:phospholipid-binding lipoprotein MlaA
MKMIHKRSDSAVLLALLSLFLGACSTAPIQQGDPLREPMFSPDRVLEEDVTYLIEEISDPIEGFNRTMYRFNYHFDRYVFLPAVSGYQAVLPDFAEKGVHNFLENLRDLMTLLNSILQLSPEKTFGTSGRIMINTTIGLAGLIDVASALDMPKHKEDFGQTLGRWGVGNGPYLVLPILGPSNLRDGTGLAVDWWAFNEIDVLNADDHEWRGYAYGLINSIDLRANTAFRYYETGSPFEYELVKLLYTTKRQFDIEK